MKNIDILPKNRQKIEKCDENAQKVEENSTFSPEAAKLLFLHYIPHVVNFYNAYCDSLSRLYSIPQVIIEVKENAQTKKETRK